MKEMLRERERERERERCTVVVDKGGQEKQLNLKPCEIGVKVPPRTYVVDCA